MKASVRRVVNAGLVLAIVVVLYLAAAPSTSRAYWRHFTSPSLSCPPEAYAAGRWERSAGELANVTKPEDVFSLSGWSGCASVQEPGWHLASTNPELYHWRTEASMARWKWVPGPGCAGFRRFDGAELVRHLVERGGWLLTGDSMTEAHFFSLSCALHPHVRAEPAANTEQHYYLRAPAQSLFLAPTSPLVRTLRLPPGFDIAQTPLVTYRRRDAPALRTRRAEQDDGPEACVRRAVRRPRDAHHQLPVQRAARALRGRALQRAGALDRRALDDLFRSQS